MADPAKEKWDGLADSWVDTGPPASPSEGDIRNFLQLLDGLLSGGSPEHVALLGATPRLRLALAEYYPETTVSVLDFSRAMYRATSRSLPVEVIHGETFCEVNWLDWSEWPTRLFDAVIGDKSLDNISFEAWPSFFDAVQRKIPTGGGLVLHVGLPDHALAGRSFAWLRDKWADAFAAGKANINQAACGLWEDLLSASARPDTRALSLASFAADIERAARSSAGDPVSARLMDLFGRSLGSAWTNFELADIERAAGQWFAMTAKLFSTDYFAAPNQPLICLTKV